MAAERVVDRQVEYQFGTLLERCVGSIHEQGGMHSGGNALSSPLPVAPHQNAARSGEPVVEGGQQQGWIKVQGQACRLLGPIDCGCWGCREEALRLYRYSCAGLASCRPSRLQPGSTHNRLRDMRAPLAPGRGMPAIPMERTTRRQRRGFGSFGPELCGALCG